MLGQALKEVYSDIFTIRSKPKKEDRLAIAGKYKSTYNVSANVAENSARTFLALLDHADIDDTPVKEVKSQHEEAKKEPAGDGGGGNGSTRVHSLHPGVGLHYNIQIHLPPTKDVEVYNAIFKSLKEHLIE